MNTLIFYIVLIVGLVVGGEMLIARHDNQVREQAALVSEKNAAKEEARQQALQAKNSAELAKKKEEENAQLKIKLDAFGRGFEAAKKSDPLVDAWANASVPSSVRELRKSTFPNAPKANLVLDPNRGFAADPGATVERRDEPKADGRSKSAEGSVGPVQPGQAKSAEGAAVPEQTSESVLKRIRAARSRP